MSLAQRFFERIYRRAKDAEDLPWYRPEPPRLLQRVVAARKSGNGARRRALDVGCGAGVYAVWLAEQGYDVTAVDFSERAITMTEARARSREVMLTAVQADVLRWSSKQTYDVILDSGCLHGFRGEERVRHRDNLLRWLGEKGDFVLVHFDKLHALDWRPVGPRRVTRGEILALFSPALAEMESEHTDMEAAFPLGPRVRLRSYWFRRNRA